MLVNIVFISDMCIILGIAYEIAIHEAKIRSYEYMLSAFILKRQFIKTEIELDELSFYASFSIH